LSLMSALILGAIRRKKAAKQEGSEA